MRLIYFFPLFLFLTACSGKEDEVIDLEEIMPTSQYDKDVRTDEVIESDVFRPSFSTSDLEAVKIIWDSVVINEELTVPERFSPKHTEKFTYWTDGKTVEYYRWSFPDSVKSMKAFLNWMNCYGDKCLMVELRKDVSIQRNAVLILQNDTSIVQIQSPFVSTGELKKWKNLYFTPEEIKWNYVITQPKGGKAVWGKFENKEESVFIQPEDHNQ